MKRFGRLGNDGYHAAFAILFKDKGVLQDRGDSGSWLVD